jgi:hypothetical protein
MHIKDAVTQTSNLTITLSLLRRLGCLDSKILHARVLTLARGSNCATFSHLAVCYRTTVRFKRSRSLRRSKTAEVDPPNVQRIVELI